MSGLLRGNHCHELFMQTARRISAKNSLEQNQFKTLEVIYKRLSRGTLRVAFLKRVTNNTPRRTKPHTDNSFKALQLLLAIDTCEESPQISQEIVF